MCSGVRVYVVVMENNTHSQRQPSLAYQELLAGLSNFTDHPVGLMDQHHHLVWTNMHWGKARRQISDKGLADWVDVSLQPGTHTVSFGLDDEPGELHIELLEHGDTPHWLLVFKAAVASTQVGTVAVQNPTQLVQAQKMESMGTLAGLVAHDFNNLLTAILGNADLLADDPELAEHHRSAVQNVIAAAELAAELCQQMMSFTASEQASKFGTVDISDLVRQMKHMIQVMSADSGNVGLQLAEHTVEVLGDAVALQQVILNLLINATQAIGPGGDIVISTGLMELGTELAKQSLFEDVSPGAYGYLCVRDTGCGVSQCNWKQLFEVAYTTKETGRGLGLAAVASIVEWHRGTVVVRSHGSGSEFLVLLPLVHAKEI